MTFSITSFTKAGAVTARQIADALCASGDTLLTLREQGAGNLSQWTRDAFGGEAIIFVGACGIAVRAIAPYVRDKFADPAVISIDEQGKYAVALLSGHVGGANALAVRVAEAVGGVPVVSTATDLNGVFAVDVWAAEQSLHLCERELAKAVSAALLDGQPVGFYSDFPVDGTLPDGLTTDAPLGICVSLDGEKQPFARTLHLIPRIVTVGAGCRRDTPPEQFEQAVRDALSAHQIAVQAVCRLATIDLKADEACMLAFGARYRVPVVTADAQTLLQTEGDFTPSAFVQQITGVDNVCERAAVRFGGALLFKKQSGNAVTVAAAANNWRVRFGR